MKHRYRMLIPIVIGLSLAVILLLGTSWTSEAISTIQTIRSPQPFDYVQDKSAIHSPQSIGGPDDFGYVYTDSLTDPGLYNWVDITASGAAVSFDDTDEYVSLPESFTFYGREHTEIYVATNGYASFQSTGIVNQCAPADRQPPETLAAFCTDLNVGNTVYYSTTTAYNGHQTFIIQYENVTHTASGLTATFQIILDFEDDSITYQYLSVPTSSTLTTTIGIIGYAVNRDDYLTYCQDVADCPPQNGPVLSRAEGMAVRFTLPPRPVLNLQITPSNDFALWGETLTYTIVMSNAGDAAANSAVMTNALPTGLDYVSGTLQAAAGVAAYLDASRTVRWEGDLAAGNSVTLTYVAVLDTDEIIYNSAVVSHPEAMDPAGATSSPADEWSDPELIDNPHRFDSELGSWRHIAVDSSSAPHVAYAGSALYYATPSTGSGQALSGTVWISETAPVTPANLSAAALALDDQDRALIAFYGQKGL